MQFSQQGGRHGRYMIHCHNLTHEDHDMMTQYQIGAHDASQRSDQRRAADLRPRDPAVSTRRRVPGSGAPPGALG